MTEVLVTSASVFIVKALINYAIAHTRIQTPAYVGVPPCPEQELQEPVRQLVREPVSDANGERLYRAATGNKHEQSSTSNGAAAMDSFSWQNLLQLD